MAADLRLDRAATEIGSYNSTSPIYLHGVDSDNFSFTFTYRSFVSFWPVENVEELAGGATGKDGVFFCVASVSPLSLPLCK